MNVMDHIRGEPSISSATEANHPTLGAPGDNGDLGVADRQDGNAETSMHKRSMSSQGSSQTWTARSSESVTLLYESNTPSLQRSPAGAKSYKDSGLDALFNDAAERPDSTARILPPRFLQHQPLRRRVSRKVIMFALYLISLALIIGYAHIKRGEGTLFQNNSDCASQTASALEARFLIDWRAAENLSFVQAKLIDLTWDTVMGQGGRFLHGWILYHVTARLVTWMMEYSALPYYFHLDMRFSSGSIKALLSSARYLAAKKPLRSLFSAAFLLYTTSYVLAFATIWSAVTGYVSPSRSVYSMPDNSFVTATGVGSDSVKLCWSIEDDRLNSSIARIVEGPSFREVFEGISFDTGTTVDWTRLKLEDVRGKSSALAPFRNIYAYAMTKRLMQLSVVGNRANFSSTMNYTTNSSVAERTDIRDINLFNPLTGVYSLYQYPDSVDGGLYQLYDRIDGWRYSGVGEFAANNGTAFQEIVPHDASYQLNYTVTPAEGIVPYNSTLWFDGAPIALQAPFLQLGLNCSWFDGLLGVCACFKGALLSEAYFQNDKRECVSEVGFVWGFSSFMLIIGCAFEMSWVVVCGLMWYEASENSQLLRLNRTGTGLTRTLLDLAEPIQRELGSDTSAHSEKELTEELAKCPPVKYVVEDTDGVTCIKLVAVSRRPGPPQWDNRERENG